MSITPSPTAGDLEVARRRNFRLVDPWVMQDLLVEKFAEPGREGVDSGH